MTAPDLARRLPRILVVDDTPDNLFLIGRLFDGRAQIMEASCGRDALRLAMDGPPPELMLLDIVMPDMDGYEVLRRLRQHPPTAAIPVVFFSALATPEQQALGRTLGAVDYLTKPVDASALMARVEAAVQAGARERRLGVLGEKLARNLSAQAWEQLFNGAGASTISFEERHLALLTVESAELRGAPDECEDYRQALQEMAGCYGGQLDRYGRDHTVLFFDRPTDALEMALALQARPGCWPAQLGLHHALCELARFRGMGQWDYALVGDEAERAVAAVPPGGHGMLQVSAACYALLRKHVRSAGRLRQALLTEKFEGDGLSHVCVVPMRPRRAPAWSGDTATASAL